MCYHRSQDQGCRRQHAIWVLMSLFWLINACSNSLSDSQPADNSEFQSEPTEEPFYAWDFTMPTFTGDEITLSNLQGQWIVVNFWATWCGPCRDEMPVLQVIHDEFEQLTVLGVNQRETNNEIRPFVEEFEITFPILINPSDQTLLDYWVIGLPQTLVINPEGVIVWRQFGPVELDIFKEQIAEFVNS